MSAFIFGFGARGAADYLSVREALRNAAKYSEAQRVTVTLEHEDGHLAFEVVDDARHRPCPSPRGSGRQMA